MKLLQIGAPQYKYIHNDGSTDELYDLIDDPEENTNWVADPSSAALCQDLRAQLFYWFDNSQKQSRKTSLHDPHADV